MLDVLDLERHELRAAGVVGRTTLQPRRGAGHLPGQRVARPPVQDINVALVLRGIGPAVTSAPRNVGDWFHPFLGWQIGDAIGQQLRLVVPRRRPHEEGLASSDRGARLGEMSPGPDPNARRRADRDLAGTVTIDRRPE